MTGLRERLASGRPQFGLWLGLANGYTAEICAHCGADWVLIDGEHAPNTLSTVSAQLQGLKGSPAEIVARPPSRDQTVIKQYLDVGVRNLLVPMVDSAEQAVEVVAATRYPPVGVRGVSSSLTRASEFGRRTDYLQTAQEGLFVFAQIESSAAVDAAEEIAAVPGVDGIFVGPADLAASLGHLGDPRHPDVQQAISHVLAVAKHTGRFTGFFATSPADGREWADRGVNFIAVGSDIGVLQRGTQELFAQARREP